MALYFYFNETTGDLVYSDQATYGVEGYVSLGQQANPNPSSSINWVFNSKRSGIQTVTKDPNISGKNNLLQRMNSMFSDCSAMRSVDLSGFDTSNVTSMSRMFYGCSDLTSLDLSNLDTSNVTDMSRMFYGCSDLTSLDVSSFDTSNVDDMSSMFSSCTALTSLDLSSFDTSNVTSMSDMFSSCFHLTSLNLSSFDTSRANVYRMFNNCTSLRVIDISPNMSNALSKLPAASYYDAVTRHSYAKGNIPGGSTYVRYIADLDLMATMVQTRMGINVAKHLAHKALNKAGSIDISGSSVDVVRVGQHKASYDRDTLELVTDGTGKVTEMWFVTAV